MMIRSLAVLSLLVAFAHASPVKSGYATAEWISGPSLVESGKPIQTGIRLVIDEGWHSYWSNPGDSGLKLSITWELPEGWTAGEVGHPVPKKFLTGDLPGYGYEGEVIFPVTITPAPGAKGSPTLSAKVSWLTCNDASCVPGKAELELSTAAGSLENAVAIEKASSLVPKPLGGAKLQVSQSKDGVKLTLALPEGSTFDPSEQEVFVATEQALDYRKAIQFQKDGEKWTAAAAKNEYADETLKELRLVLAKKGEAPVEVFWKGE